MNRNQPNSWAIAPLSAIAKLIRGVSFSGSDAESSPKTGYLPVLRAGNIAEKLITDQDLVWIPESRVSPEQRMLKDDIAICMSSGSGAVVGKTARLEKDWVGCVGAFCSIIRPQGNVNADFLAHYLSGPQFAYWRRSQAQGANIQNLRVSELERFKVPLPPISEQQRIVKILQEAEAIRRLRVIAETKAADVIPAIFYNHFLKAKLHDCIPLSTMADIVSGVAIGRTIRGGGVRELAYIRVANVQAGYIDLDEIKTTKASKKEIEDYSLHSGDILMTEGGDFDKLGRGCLWEGQVEPCIHQNHVFRVRPYQGNLHSLFLAQYLQTPAVRHYFLRCAKKTTNLASINLTQLKNLPVPKIPFNLQEAFAREVEEARACFSIDTSRVDNLLIASLQANAFTGQLTALWREKHQEQLEQEARQRDEALQAAGAIITRPVRIETIEARYIRRSDGAYAELTREQHTVLEAIPRGEDAARWFTPEELAATIDGPLRGNRQAIASHLAVLAARGLVIAASLEQTAPDTGAVFYGNAYRLPLDDFDPAEDDPREPVVGDRARLREMARIVAQLEQGR